jgi:hypothetical protein
MRVGLSGKSSMVRSVSNTSRFAVGEYRDDIHAEEFEGLTVGEQGYKFRLVEGVVMPPYVTPARYKLSRTLSTRPGDIC